jgi:Terpene synthase family 2, C-terminal metal binding
MDLEILVPLPVPSLWCPFPEFINQQWQEINAKSVAWMHSFGLARNEQQFQRLAATESGALAGRTTDADIASSSLQAYADMLIWLFAVDDTYCDEGIYRSRPDQMSLFAAQLIRVAQTGGAPRAEQVPAVAALRDLRLRLEDLATPVQISRWVSALSQYLWYQAWEASYRVCGRLPTVDDYLVARITNGAVPPCVMSLDIACGFAVPAAEMEHPVIRALTEMCCAVVSYDNDIISYWKEMLRCGDHLNLIDVIAAEEGCTVYQALPMGVAIRDRVFQRYLTVRDHLCREFGPLTRRYVGLLDRWIRGNLDWSMQTARYVNPDKPANLPRLVAAQQATSEPEPLPYPGVRWWWEMPSNLPHQRLGLDLG